MRKLALSGNTQNQTLAKIVYIFLLFQLALSITVTSLNENEVTDIMILQKGRKQREFDYFVLALQWPGTVCNATRHCCSTNACCRRSGSPAEFTLHGLWPDYNDGSWPSCCTRSRFDEKEIQSLLHPLNQYWPSLSCGSPSTCHGTKGSFWAHEWEKHGTCSYPVVHDEYNYFLMTLNIYFKYNVTRVLNDAGYVPSNTEKYPLGGVISAIENAFHQTPLLVCSRGAIEELRLCFYKDLEPRDCVQTDSQNALISSKISCPSYVSLPVYETGGRILKGIISSDSSIQGNLRVRTSMIMKMKKQWILIRKARGQTMKITIVE